MRGNEERARKKRNGEVDGLLAVLAGMEPEILFQLLEQIDTQPKPPTTVDEKLQIFGQQMIQYELTHNERVAIMREGKKLNGGGWSTYLLRLWALYNLEEAKVNYHELSGSTTTDFLEGDRKKAARHKTPNLEIWYRSKGRCETCGKEDDFMIVGHKYHNGKDYNDPENLLLHCFGCETLHHLAHIGKAHKIAMGEKENKGTSYGLLVAFLQYSPKDFIEFYEQNQTLIDVFLEAKHIDFQHFFERYKPEEKPYAKKRNNASYHQIDVIRTETSP